MASSYPRNPLPLKTSDDAIWSLDAGAAHRAGNANDLQQSLIERFGEESGGLPEMLRDRDDHWIAYYYREGDSSPVYWTGA